MTFGNLNEVNDESSPSSMPLKVSYGEEIRRATINNNINNNNPSFDGLRDHVANLFGLDSASVTLKYQDDDGDNITMSSDAELKDAILAVKEKNMLRLFVAIKAPPAPTPAAQEGNLRAGPFHGFPRGSFGPHSFGPHYGPHYNHHSHPSSAPPSHPHGPHGGAYHHGPHHHHARGGYHHGPHHNHGGNHPLPSRPIHRFSHSSTGAAPFPSSPFPFPPHASKEESIKVYKDRKCEMKNQIRMMKENATTEDDRKAIKEMKMQFKGECKQFKGDYKQAKHHHHHHHEKMEKKRTERMEKMEKMGKNVEEKKMRKEMKREMKRGKLCAKHVSDVTIPDNSELPADTPVTKTWRLKNVGMTAWPTDSQLIFISHRGDNLNGPERVQVGEVKEGEEVDVSVTFITPSLSGRYIGYYRMATGDGNKFGQRLWVSFFVPFSPSPVSSASPASPLSSSFPSSSMAPMVVNVPMD